MCFAIGTLCKKLFRYCLFTEGGKIDIYDLDKEAITISSKAHDEALVSIVVSVSIDTTW